MPFLTFPLALIALIALPAAAAIYLLRSRYRDRTVSSLLLWTFSAQAREGGTQVRKPRFPWLLLLELLILLALVLAAVDPRWKTSDYAEPLFVVLDHSASMQALDAQGESRLEAARKVLKKEVKRGGFSSLRILLAGTRVQLAGPAVKTWEELTPQLEAWTAPAPTADLSAAIAMASELGRQQGRVLVITDHAAPDLEAGDVRWISVGSARPNQAIIQASRKHGTLSDRCLLEIANYSHEPAQTTLTLTDQQGESRHHALSLQPGSIHRLIFDEPPTSGPLTAQLSDDALAVDNRAWLTASPPGKVSIKVEISDPALREPIEQALAATGRSRYTYADPELLFVDQAPSRRVAASTWVVQIDKAANAKAYTGPFLTLSGHPLLQGVDLTGTIWAAATNGPSGLPVVSAGTVPLLQDRERNDGGHHVSLQWNPTFSSLQQTPNWPILIWNLLEWRHQEAPGLKDSSIRLGTASEVRTHELTAEVILEGPTGSERFTPVQHQVHLQPELPGWYTVKANARDYALAVNFLQPDESNVAGDLGGEWGRWGERSVVSEMYAATAWIWVLLALGGLYLHAALLARGAGQ